MEPKEAMETLNNFCKEIYDGKNLNADERVLWHSCFELLCNNGYRWTRHNASYRNPGPAYFTFTNKPSRRDTCNVAEWVKFAPICDHHNECTTRALYFCLDEKIPYDDIRKEQNEKAKKKYPWGRCYGWNMACVWETVLTDRGFVRIDLEFNIRRDKLARLLKDCGRILTHSSGHCASIFEGRVYDSWNSSLGRVNYIMVDASKESMVRKILASN